MVSSGAGVKLPSVKVSGVVGAGKPSGRDAAGRVASSLARWTTEIVCLDRATPLIFNLGPGVRPDVRPGESAVAAFNERIPTRSPKLSMLTSLWVSEIGHSEYFHWVRAALCGDVAAALSVFQTLREMVTVASRHRMLGEVINDDDVPDPYRRGPEAFEASFELIKTAVDVIVEAAWGPGTWRKQP